MSNQHSSSVSCLFLGAQEDCQILALERNASYLNTCYVNKRDTKAFIVLRCYAAWYQKKVNSGKKNQLEKTKVYWAQFPTASNA